MAPDREVLLHPEVVQALEELGDDERARIEDALGALAGDPFTPRSGADIKKLRGTGGRQDLYRFRIGDWRAVYAVEGDEVRGPALFRRGEGYDI